MTRFDAALAAATEALTQERRDAPEAGRVEAIFLAGERGAPRTAVEQVRAVAGSGLEGDRYFGHVRGGGKRDPERQVTLIEAEAVDAARATGAALAPGDARRNVVTRGVRLNELVGRTFRVGGALLRGVERCDPCSRLTRLTYRGVERDLRDRGGLRAEILESGYIRVGDSVGEIHVQDQATAVSRRDAEEKERTAKIF